MATHTSTRLAAALAGRYRIESELGAGGMATVWLAQDLKHNRKVAIKVLHPHLAALVGAERFLKEIQTTANLQHPHILPLFDSGEADGLLFYVMPLVDGESLRQRILREKQLSIADAVRITSELASALDYAHRQGVIHRDIKPENILLHDGRALVADFGIALAPDTADTRLTETGMSIGTPLYMSPEQALGERQLDARSDIYAIGAVLYELLTGTPPFNGPSAQAIVAKVISQKPVPPSRLRREIPAQVEETLLTALQKDPANRFATAAAMQSALAQGGPTRIRRRPMPRAPAFAAIVIAILLAGGAYLATHKRQTRDSPPLSIAAVPFRTQDSADAYLGEQIPQEILDALTHMPGLTVRPLASAVRFRNNENPSAIANELKVGILLTGSVDHQANSIRITARRYDVSRNLSLPAVTFTDNADNTFALEDSVAATIVSGFKLTQSQAQLAVSRAGRTTNPAAHDTLMLARWYARQRTPQAMQTAVTLYLDALRQDSRYAEAWAGLAQAQNLRAVFLAQAPTPKFDSAHSAIQHALALDSNSADAHQALGFYHVMHDRNYPDAGRQFTRALQLNRNDPETWLFRGWYYLATNRVDSAVQAIRHASELDPTAAVIGVRLANVLDFDGKTKQAEDELNRVLTLDSTFQPARGALAEVYAADGQCDKAAEQVRHFDSKHLSQIEAARIPVTWALCGPRSQAMRYTDSMATRARTGEYVGAFALARIYAALGDTTKVQVWLKNAVKDQDWPLFQLRVDPRLKGYGSKPWFNVVLQQLKLIDD